MSIITSLGDAIKAVGEKLSPDQDKLTPVAMSVYVAYASKFVREVGDSLKEPAIAERLKKFLVDAGTRSTWERGDEKAYDAMSADFVPLLRRRAKTDPAGIFKDACDQTVITLDELSDKAGRILPGNGLKAGDDIKMSTALALGYVEQAIRFASWVQFVIDHALSYGETPTGSQAKYTYTFVSDYAEDVTTFINQTVTHDRTSVVDRLLNLKNSAKDVSLSDPSNAAASYLDDNAYDSWEQNTAQGIIRNPISMYYTFKEQHRLGRIETLRNRMNWLKERMSLLSMKNMGTDPNSAEYKKTQSAVQYYADLVSDYDKKIAALS